VDEVRRKENSAALNVKMVLCRSKGVGKPGMYLRVIVRNQRRPTKGVDKKKPQKKNRSKARKGRTEVENSRKTDVPHTTKQKKKKVLIYCFKNLVGKRPNNIGTKTPPQPRPPNLRNKKVKGNRKNV